MRSNVVLAVAVILTALSIMWSVFVLDGRLDAVEARLEALTPLQVEPAVVPMTPVDQPAVTSEALSTTASVVSAPPSVSIDDKSISSGL